MKQKIFSLRRALTIALMLALIGFEALPTGAVLAEPQSQPVAGELSPTGNVTINGLRAAPGDTVLNGAVLTTQCDGTAVVSLGRLGRFELSPGSEMVVSLAATAIGGQLRAGTLIISAPVGIAVSVGTDDGVVTSAGQEVSVFTVDRTLGNTRVTAQRSGVRVAFDNRVEYVAAGQETAVGAQNPGQGARCTRLATAGAGGGLPGGVAAGGLSGGQIAALVAVSLGAVAAATAAITQSDNVRAQQIATSTFIP